MQNKDTKEIMIGVKESRIDLKKGQIMGETVFRKPGVVFVLPQVVEQNVKQKPGMNLAELPWNK